MARKKKRQEGGGASWMTTFSDLMNLLVCFFVLLFSMSTIDEVKFEELISSLQNNFSIFDGGGTSFTEGILITSGVSQIEDFDGFYENMIKNQDVMNQQMQQTQEEYEEKKEQDMLQESEKMEEEIEAGLKAEGIDASLITIQAETQYVMLTLNGSLLFDSGSATIRNDSREFIGKIADVLMKYDSHDIQIIGHTDTVPQSTSNTKYSDNMELSQGRAYSVYKYLVEEKHMDASTMGCMGRGETSPIASNDTSEGRAQNRRVEIRIFNTYNSSGSLD